MTLPQPPRRRDCRTLTNEPASARAAAKAGEKSGAVQICRSCGENNALHFLTYLIWVPAFANEHSNLMKMHHFVSGSAVILAGWLMVTFFHDVSPQQYPQQRRGAPAHAAANREPLKGELPRDGMPEAATTVAASRVP